MTNLIQGWIRQPWKQPLQTFSNALQFRKSRYRDLVHHLDTVLPRLQVPRKMDQTGVSVTAAMEAGMLQHMEDKEERWFTPSEVLLCLHAHDSSLLAGVLILDIFGLYSGYILIQHGISLQLDSGGAKESNCAASSARVQSSWDASRALIQHYQTLLQELQGDSEDIAESPAARRQSPDSRESADTYQQECTLLCNHNFNVACETGIPYSATT